MTYTHADQEAETALLALEGAAKAIRSFVTKHGGGQLLLDYVRESYRHSYEGLFNKDPRLRGLRVIPCCGVRSFAPFLEEEETCSGSLMLALDGMLPGVWLAWTIEGDDDNSIGTIGPIDRDQLLRLFKDPENDYLPHALAACLKEEVVSCAAQLLADYRQSVLVGAELIKLFPGLKEDDSQ